MRAVGSRLSIDSHNVMPSPSLLKTTGAIERRFGGNVTVDSRPIEHAECHAGVVTELDARGIGEAHQRHSRDERQRLTGAALELCDALRRCPGLAEDLRRSHDRGQNGHLIGSDDPSVGVARRDGVGLLASQARDQLERRFPGSRRFIDTWRLNLEPQLQP